jgi:VWFA-related protein
MLLPVTVRTKKGKPVPGLTKADFTLTEDGHAEPIASFQPASAVPLSLVLTLDTAPSMLNSLDAQRSAGKSFLASVLTQLTDKGAVLHFDREVELLKDLTGSQAELGEGLAETGPTRGTDTAAPTTSDNGDQGRGETASRGRYAGNQLYDAIYLASHDLLGSRSGRKIMVVISDGVDRGSKERQTEAIEAAVKAGVEIYTIYYKGEEDHSAATQQGGGNQGGGQRRGGIGFPGGGGGYPGGGGGGGGYPGGGGSGGGRRQPAPEAKHVDGKAILGQIATKTGGWPYEAKKPENFDGILKEIATDLGQQVVLGYVPDPTGRGAVFHRITLTTKDKDQFVQVREGYYGVDPDAN